MGDGSGGANTADSYIGSLISLTSKSEIRYEGILYTVDTENSNIALQNVRSFGTEGRKKDGLPILASDKVYDYIIFRGSDIKDLQVKSSPSIQPPPQPPSDPAIISLQSQYSQPAPITPGYVQPPPGPQDAGPQLPYPGNFPSAFRGGVPPLYQHQPTAGLGSWGPPPPPPGPNGTGLAMPMYWQAGYYRQPPTAQPILQQPLHPQPPPSLPMPPAPQHQVLQQPPRPSPPLNLVNSVPPVTSSFSSSLSSALSQSSAPSNNISTPLPPVTVSGAASSTSVSASAPVSAPTSVPSSAPASVAPSAVQGVSAVITPAAKNPRRVVGTIQPSPPQPQSSGAAVGNTTSTASASTTSTTATVTQRSQPTTQALQGTLSSAPGKNAGTNAVKQEQKAAEPAKSQAVTSTTGQAPQQQTQPLLPLPTSSAPHHKQGHQGNGSVGHNYSRRGRGRGNGGGRGVGVGQPTQQFTEDFDFTAMNEKFNKDEVWGELGKGSEARDKVGDAEEEDLADGHADEEVADGTPHKISPDVPKKPVYVKDDFFDSLSCDALDREEGRAERTKFSEQRKIDTETFGNFPLRSRGGRGGRGRRGGYRGGFYGGGYMSGRGNGYGRGRGGPRSATAIN
ncbi:hypothetical protein R1sor_022703 [Riccia sorocarpa]|uniref:Protein decapping 5 n=1 Tax=Riccia sorocarpa TaxID=122646 RepID=A0ABD3GNL3_9MARC